MPMPKASDAQNTSAATKESREETFSPYKEDQEQEENSAVATTNAISVPSVPITYDYVPAAEDLNMPRVILLQGNAEIVLQGQAKAGDWQLPGSEYVTEFSVTVLGMRRSRMRSVKQDNEDRPTMLCTSPDSVQGYGNPGILCRECPFGKWGEKDPTTGKGKPPECRLRYHYLVETSNGDRAEMMISTTTKASKAAATAITEGIARWGNGGTFGVTMTRKLAESNGNRYFVPIVKAVYKIEDDEENIIDA